LLVNPNAREEARVMDAERRAGRVRGPLHGVPILLKDNIETRDMPTTAGSLALANNNPGRDAPVTARLRAAGALILGKTNLSEWANIRSTNSSSGWSAAGGLTRSPYALDRTACGSSSGSGVAAAASLAAAAVGTETNGSVVCPAQSSGLVGLKPTVGLVSRTHIVPISSSQDTAGPMTRTVSDAAMLLNAMAGSDPADAATREADRRRTDYMRGLSADALRGKRIGVMRFNTGFMDHVDAEFEKALEHLRAGGAELVDLKEFPRRGELGRHTLPILLHELKDDLGAYLASTDPRQVPTRNLADVISFNEANKALEMPWFGQELFIQAQATKGTADPEYRRRPRRPDQAAPPRRHGGAHRRARLDHRPDQRRQLRRRLLHPPRGRGLSQPHRAHGPGEGSSRRHLLHRPEVVGSDPARPRLRLRTARPRPLRAELPAHYRRPAGAPSGAGARSPSRDAAMKAVRRS
jgi:amidase